MELIPSFLNWKQWQKPQVFLGKKFIIPILCHLWFNLQKEKANCILRFCSVKRQAKIINALKKPWFKIVYDRDKRPLTRRDVIDVLLGTSTSSAIRDKSDLELRFQGVDLEAADLSRLDLRHINFKYANLRGANLAGESHLKNVWIVFSLFLF